MGKREGLDHHLRAADRVPSGFANNNDATVTLDAIGEQIVATVRPIGEVRRRGRFAIPSARRGVVLGSVVGLLAVGGAAAAAVSILVSSTVGAPGFCQTALNATADVPFPSGYQAWQNWALLESVGPNPGITLHELCDTPAGKHVADGGYPGRFVIPTISEKVMFTTAAFCAWTDDWLKARSEGDTATESQAAGEIAAAQQWPSTQAIQRPDSHVGPQQLAWFVPVQHAVQDGDVRVVNATLNYEPHGSIPDSECFMNVPPSNSDNGTIVVAER